MIRFAFAVYTLVALTVWSPSAALPQAVSNATIHGIVVDSSGAVVPSAQIKAKQIDMGQTRSTASDSDGSYTLPTLPIGPYSIEVTAPGFSSYVQSGVVLQVG